MFLDQWNQHHQDVHVARSNIQHDANQNLTTFFSEMEMMMQKLTWKHKSP